MTRILCAVFLIAASVPALAPAQQPAQRQLDSLAAEVRALRLRLDSLRAAVARGAPPRRADTARAAVDEDIAALRAAAASMVGRDTIQTADTMSARQFVGRERNQAQLNPEISVTGDVRVYGTTKGVQTENFEPREFEVGFQSALDPYSHTKIFLSFEKGGISVEEGYAYWTGLPGHIRLDLGKYRQQFGELNRWHLHAVPETEYPLAIKSYLGEDGLAGTGLSLYRAFGGLGTHEVTLQVTRSASDELFGNSGRPTYLAHLLNFWQLTRSTYMQLGGSILYGTRPDTALRTRVAGLDFRLTWRPPSAALYREWTVRGELLAFRQQIAGVGPTRIGGYVSSTYKLGQRWIAGLAYNYVESRENLGAITRQIIPSLTLWESEWVFLRGQYRWEKVAGVTATHQLALQAVWAIGPHKHETY
jgi:hypothetical protein